MPAVKSSRVDDGEMKLRLSEVSVSCEKIENESQSNDEITSFAAHELLPPPQRYAKIKSHKENSLLRVIYRFVRKSKSRQGLWVSEGQEIVNINKCTEININFSAKTKP